MFDSPFVRRVAISMKLFEIPFELTQADVTVVCAFTFLNDALRVGSDHVMYESLAMLAARCESLPAFQDTREPFQRPIADS